MIVWCDYVVKYLCFINEHCIYNSVYVIKIFYKRIGTGDKVNFAYLEKKIKIYIYIYLGHFLASWQRPLIKLNWNSLFLRYKIIIILIIDNRNVGSVIDQINQINIIKGFVVSQIRISETTGSLFSFLIIPH